MTLKFHIWHSSFILDSLRDIPLFFKEYFVILSELFHKAILCDQYGEFKCYGLSWVANIVGIKESNKID